MLSKTTRLFVPLAVTLMGALTLAGCGGGGSNNTPAPAPVVQTTAVSVALSGNSMGSVTSNPAGINCPSDCNETLPRSSMVTLTATPTNSNNIFMSWGSDAAGCGTSANCTLLLTSANLNVVANFQPITRALSVSKTGSGMITSDPAGISCDNTCTGSYQQGTIVSLSAVAANGFTFQAWGGACSGATSCVVTMDANKVVTATFISNNVTLSLTKAGNGRVTSAPAGIDCGSTCSASYARNSSVTLTATGLGADVFQGWSGGGCSGTGTCSPSLAADVTVTAQFTSTQTPGPLYGLTNTNRIVSFDAPAAPGPVAFSSAAAITGLPSGETVVAIDTRPLDGLIYGITSASRIVTIDLSSGAATVRSTLSADSSDTSAPYTSLSGTVRGIDFNPTVDRLRIVTDSGQNLRVNVDTGTVITDTALNPGTPAVIDPAYSFNFNGSTSTSLFVIDSGTDKLYQQTPPNDGTLVEVGALGVNAGGLGGFEIVGSNVEAYAALKVTGGGASGSLYGIDLRTGAASKLGDFAGAETVISMAAAIAVTPPALGDLALLTASGKLVTLNRSAPGSLRTSANITGVPAAETLLDIDYRPRNGAPELYLLSRDSGGTGRLYTVDPTTGAATVKSTVGGATPTVLTGSNTGIDFNPVADRLRIVTSSGQNLRVNVDDGSVTTDTAIAAASSVIVAAGYTNSFLQASSTTLFTIDSNNRSLNIQNPPNNGTQVAVGSLNLATVTAPVGFDIDGRNNEGLMSMTDSGTPKLYSVNLATGAATGAQALAISETVKGLSLRTAKEPEVFALSSTGNLLRFTSSTSASYSTIGAVTLPGSATVLGMDFRPRTGQLVVLGSDAKLYTLNPTTAEATLLSTLSADPSDTTDGNATFTTALIASSNSYALDFNAVVDRLRIVGSNNANLRVAVDTGLVTTDDNVGRPPATITGAAYTNDATPLFYGIDSASDRLFSINTSTGGMSQVGPLGVDIAGVNGFDIIGSSEAYVVSVVGGSTKLYTLTLSTGATTLRAAVSLPSGATSLLAFSAHTSANNDLYAITDNSRLVAFDRNAPNGSLLVNRALTGIGAGEAVIGMDFSAAGALYLVTVSGNTVGRVYTVDLTNGAATPVTGMTNALPPTTVSSFTLPPATAYGVEFRPGSASTTPPATTGSLRFTTDTLKTLEVNLSTFATTAVTTLSQPAPVITSEAYTNSFAGATRTTLYALDTANDSLMTQSTMAPTTGQLFDVRALSVLVDGFGGFDILGGADGYVVGVLRATATPTYSTLYRIDLSDGAMSSLGDVGNATTGTTMPRVQITASAVRFTP